MIRSAEKDRTTGPGNISHQRSYRRMSGFLRRKDGAAAVEFALIALPLLTLIFACLELALILILQVTLDNATQRASREVRTGIMTAGNSSVNAFRTKVCDNMGWMEGLCAGSLQVDVRTFDSFAQVPTPDPIKDGEFDPTAMTYNIGGGTKIQLVRTYMPWPMLTPFLAGGFATMKNGDAVVSSKVVFRNEPF